MAWWVWMIVGGLIGASPWFVFKWSVNRYMGEMGNFMAYQMPGGVRHRDRSVSVTFKLAGFGVPQSILASVETGKVLVCVRNLPKQAVPDMNEIYAFTTERLAKTEPKEGTGER